LKPVTIYLTEWCPFCVRARQILDQHHVAYEAIDVDGDTEKRAWLRTVTGQRTVPQIFFGEESIGGCSELEGIVRAGDLMSRLA
jgi:glutaredoxin 3